MAKRKKMSKRQRDVAEQAMALVPVVINAMGRSFPGIRRKIARIDSTSVAYLAICKAAQTYDAQKSKVTTYFSSAIRNAILKEVARSQRRACESAPIEMASEPDVVAPQWATREILVAALRSLPAQERGLLESRYYGRMSVQEIADERGMAAKSVRARLRRAVELLSEILETHSLLREQQPGRWTCSSDDR